MATSLEIIFSKILMIGEDDAGMKAANSTKEQAVYE